MRPSLDGERRARESSVEAKGRDSASALVLQKLEVVEGAAAAREACQDVGPAALALVAMRKLHVRVLERERLLGELLEPDDDVVGRGRGPAALGDQGRAYIGEFGVVEDAQGAAFNVDGVAGVEEGFGCGWGQGGAVLEGLGLEGREEEWLAF